MTKADTHKSEDEESSSSTEGGQAVKRVPEAPKVIKEIGNYKYEVDEWGRKKRIARI